MRQNSQHIIDSKYAFHILYNHTCIWQEVFLIPRGTSITNGPLILKLLKASYLPKQAAVIYHWGYPACTSDIVLGNAFTGKNAKETSQHSYPSSSVLPLAPLSWIPTQDPPGYENCDGSLELTPYVGQVLSLRPTSKVLPSVCSRNFHDGAWPVCQFLHPLFLYPTLSVLLKLVTRECPTCTWALKQGALWTPLSFIVHQFQGSLQGRTGR